ncbi:MAG: DedA family protein [Candidatus Paceibacterota bacterium]
MFPPPFLAEIIGGALGHPISLAFTIIFGTLILEDPTIVLVGVLASDGFISAPLGLLSLYAGVILGDIAFFSLGRYASTHPRFAKYIDHKYVAPARTWLETRYILTVFCARFIPGSRFPTYAASGFIGSSFSTFFVTVIVATSLWTTLLFMLSYWFGSITAQWLHNERWIIAAVFVGGLFLLSRLTVLHNRFFKSAPSEPNNDPS